MEIREQVKENANVDKAQECEKKNYDAKHQPLLFKEGDTVLLKNMRNDARKILVKTVHYQQHPIKRTVQAPKQTGVGAKNILQQYKIEHLFPSCAVKVC